MALIVNQNPWQLFMDYQAAANENIAEHSYYVGVLDSFRLLNVPPGILFAVQVLLCVACVFIFSNKLKNAPAHIIFLAPAVFSTCWMYTQPTNIPVLAIMVVAILLTVPRSNNIYLYLLLCFLLLPTPEIFRRTLPVLFPLLQRLIYLAGMFLLIRDNDSR
jgi:hypothetical protein